MHLHLSLVYLTVQIESVELGRIYYAPPDTEKGMVQLQSGLHAEVWVTTKEKSMSVACVNIEVIDILAMVSKQVISSCVALKAGMGLRTTLLRANRNSLRWGEGSKCFS